MKGRRIHSPAHACRATSRAPIPPGFPERPETSAVEKGRAEAPPTPAPDSLKESFYDDRDFPNRSEISPKMKAANVSSRPSFGKLEFRVDIFFFYSPWAPFSFDSSTILHVPDAGNGCFLSLLSFEVKLFFVVRLFFVVISCNNK